MSFDAELKERWTNALRSGRYSQGTGQLRQTTDKHCCLGVALDLIDPSCWSPTADGYWWQDPECDADGHCDDDSDDAQLPGATRDRIGMTEGEMIELMGMNDHGKSFGDIADWIEKHL